MIEARRAVDLRDWAIANRDMAPHVDTLKQYASAAKVIVEFGVRSAVSTWAFLDGLPEDGRMWSVDVIQSNVPPRVYGDQRWTFLVGSDLDPKIRAQLPVQADLVFIDTSHEYAHTVQEMKIAAGFAPKVILMHDAYWPGVRRALDEIDQHISGWQLTRIDEASDGRGDFSLAVVEPK
jgi:predicted O-methyltransferase YrrM